MNYLTEDGKCRTVLVIDDDPMTTELFSEILEDYCEVKVANSIDDAMQIIHAEQLTVVISDYHVGRGGAERLFEWMLVERPELVRRFILLTGDKMADLSLFEEKATVLFKPVHIEELLNTVTPILLSSQELAR